MVPSLQDIETEVVDSSVLGYLTRLDKSENAQEVRAGWMMGRGHRCEIKLLDNEVPCALLVSFLEDSSSDEEWDQVPVMTECEDGESRA